MAGRKFDKIILSEEGSVKFDFMTSLQNIVMAKIVSNLWMNKRNLQDIVNFIYNGIRPRCIEESSTWQKVKNNVVANIAELPLPKSMRERLNSIVPVLGNCIFNWIRYHECILNSSDYSAVDQINHIAWTARGKIDYAQTTKNILGDKDNCLCDDHKYKLACINCLEDEIAVLAPNVVNPYYLDSLEIQMHPMVYFWTAHITGDNTNLYKHIRDNKRNLNIHCYIMRLLLKSNKKFHGTPNEVPIRYLWERDINKVKENPKNITCLIKQLSNQELIYTLLSSLDFEKQQRVFRECSDIILIGILNDWLWGEYFLPIALHFLDIMQPSHYLFILKHLNKEMSKSFQEENKYLYNKYRYFFKELWQEGCELFERENVESLVDIVFSFLLCQDMDVIGLILKDLNEEQRKSIIFDYGGILYCVNFIKDYKWDLLDCFIKFTLSSEENINQLKNAMLNDWWDEISEHFLMYEAYDKIEYFMSWASKSEEEIDGLRKSLAYRKCEARLESVISNNTIGFTNLENHFKWCANGDLDVINQFKAEILYLYSEKLIMKLIQNEKYEFLDNFLNWCFSGNLTNVISFKSDMYRHDNLKAFFRSITAFLIRKDYSFKTFDNFVVWLFTNHQEIQEFKMWLLYPLEKSCSVCASFLVENQFELADKFIEWCVTSAKEIKPFKKMLMLSEDLISIFEIYNCKKKPYLPFLIKWFNPSKKLVKAFKRVYPVEKCPNNFYNLLHDFLKNRNSFLFSYQ